MDRNSTSSRHMPVAAMLAGVFIVLLLSGCPSKQGAWHKINADSLLTADKPMMDSMKAIPALTPTVISVDSLRKLLGVTAAVHDTTLLRWLRYSSRTTQTVSYSPLLSIPSKPTPMVSAFGGDKLPTFFIHDNPPPETYSVMPDFSDHEVSTSFNCVSTHYPSGLEMLAGQMGATIFSWTPTSSGRPFWFAPYSGAVTGCNPNDPSSYAPYMLSGNQTVKWSGTAHEVKSQFIGALNAFAHADRSSGVVYTLLVGNLKWGDVSTMPYLGVSFYTVTFPPAPPTSSTVVAFVVTLID